MSDMLKKFEDWTDTIAFYPEAGTGSNTELMYCALGLCGEAGEVADNVKKLCRENGDTPERREKMQEELGDVVWYIARLAKALDLSIEELLQYNMDKIAKRQVERPQLFTGLRK